MVVESKMRIKVVLRCKVSLSDARLPFFLHISSLLDGHVKPLVGKLKKQG